MLFTAATGWAQTAPAASAVPSAAPARAQVQAASAPPPRPWLPIPRLGGRLSAADIGLVINTADPYSVAVGRHYIAARGLKPAQVLRLRLPTKAVLSREEFEALAQAIEQRFGADAKGPQPVKVQALALAWQAPYAVECNSITGALALGFDAELCRDSCKPSRVSRYFNAATTRPFTSLGWRPAMLLAAPTVAAAQALIDRGVASDGSLATTEREPVAAMLLLTDDPARSVRRVLYPEPGLRRPLGVDLRVVPAAELPAARRVFMVTTGSLQVPAVPAPDWVPGGLGDHLTSYGGDLQGTHGQGTVLDWIASGATASHGSVSEPCNHLQKFPHPQVLLGHYVQGATVLEAYWKSVAWPQQSLFVGEPLAAPFSPPLLPARPTLLGPTPP